MQVVGESTGARTEHQDAGSARKVAGRLASDRLEAGAILLVAPAPVAVQVGIVGRESLADRQLGAERGVHRRRLVAARDAEGSHQLADAHGLVVERRRHAVEAHARLGVAAVRRGRRAGAPPRTRSGSAGDAGGPAIR